MRQLIKFIHKMIMVNYMHSRLIHTGQMPSELERKLYL